MSFIDKLLGLWPRKKTAEAHGKLRRFKCRGGPFDGATLPLLSPGTLTFGLRGHFGRYVRTETPGEIAWEPLMKEENHDV